MSQTESWKTREGDQRRILRMVKKRVEELEGRDPVLKRFSRDLHRELAGPWKTQTISQFRNRLIQAPVILAADFHSHSPSQRCHIEILRFLSKQGPLQIGMEAIDSRHQGTLDRFLSGKISEARFLKRVQWNRNWGFPWENYKPIFDFARARGLSILALNRSNLGKKLADFRCRDIHMARVLGQALGRAPEKRLFCIVGDLHLVKGNLPREIKRRVGDVEIVRVFQDIENLYFRSLRDGNELGSNHFAQGDRLCVLTSPPWVRWRSYISFLETRLLRKPTSDLEMDLEEDLSAMGRVFRAQLGLPLFPETDFEVFLHLDPRQSAPALFRVPTALRPKARELIRAGRSFYQTETRTAHLARSSPNEVARITAEAFLAHATDHRVGWARFARDFEAQVVWEALVFFLTKLLNPARSPETFHMEHIERGHGAGPALLLSSWSHRWTFMSGGAVPSRSQSPSWLENWDAARILGGNLGQRIYLAFRGGGLETSLLRQWIEDLEKGRRSGVLYESLSKKIDILSA